MATSKEIALQVLLAEFEKPLELEVNDYYLPGTDVIPAVLQTVQSKAPTEPLGTVRILDYVEKTVPLYSDPLFKAHFRMSRGSFEELLQLIAPCIEIKTISLEKGTLACLWYLCNQETFRSIVDRFGLSKGSLHYFLGNFCRVMTSNEIIQKLIQWPKTPAELNTICEKFSQRAGFPNVIGAIDGTYIPILGPNAFRECYICRKGFPAFHLQGVCDSDLRFLDVFAAYPGSVHDARVFK